MTTFTDTIDVKIEDAQNTGAFPLTHSLLTQESKISGFVMLNSSPGNLNFNVIVPPNISTPPNAKIRIYLISLTKNPGGASIDFVLSTNSSLPVQVIDQSLTIQNELIVEVNTPPESLQTADIPFSTTLKAGQLITGQITRNTPSTYDTAENILVLRIQLLVDVNVT